MAVAQRGRGQGERDYSEKEGSACKHVFLSCEMSGCQNKPIMIAPLRHVLHFLVFLIYLPPGNGRIERHVINTDLKDEVVRKTKIEFAM